jgi:hypothetical protein
MAYITELSGKQKKNFRNALVSAFSNEKDLNMLINLVFDKNLNQIASPGNMEQQVFEIINWALAQGKIMGLITGALEERPLNRLLIEFAISLGMELEKLSEKKAIEIKIENPNQELINLLLAKKNFLQKELILAYDAEKKFALESQIKEIEEKIEKLKN